MLLEDSTGTPDFLVTARVKVVEWQGAPPAVYVYGRAGKDGFRALSFSGKEARLFCYYGQEKPAAQLGRTKLQASGQPFWAHLMLACFRDHVFAKAWLADCPEPAWQIEGGAPGHESGLVGLGVWTSPRTPSTAKVLFDDVRFVPLSADTLKQWGIRPEPRPPLDVRVLPDAPGAFLLKHRLGLASGRTGLTFDRETGEIANLVDQKTGQEFISSDVKRPLFRLTLTKPYQGKRVELTSRDFRTITVQQAGQKSLRLDFREPRAYSVSVSVEAALLDADSLRLSLRVKNQSDWCVASILFPHVPAPAALGEDASDDYALLPWSSGALLQRPGSRTVWRDAMYPGAAFAQFYALYDATAGVYVAAYDPAGHCKRLRLNCGANRFVSLAFEHLFPERPGEDAALPYEVVLRTFEGDWRDAADQYKGWAARQKWCARRLADRDEVPQFLKDGSGIIITPVNNPVHRARMLGEDLEKLPDLMDAYRERTGLKHLVFVPYGWENRGTWAGINYLPAVPSDEHWRRAARALQKRGHRIAFLTSGFWWVIKRQQTGNGPAFDDTSDFEQRKEMCIQNPDGSTWFVDWYDRTKQFGTWRGLSAKLCHGSRPACHTMKRIFLDVAALGVPLVSFDQEIGGGQNAPCYSKTHGHAPGYGRWMWTGFRDLCADILREGKPIQPELGLFLENVGELAIPYMSTYWSRQFCEVEVGVSGGRGIGLFSYLYHEYVTAIGAACVQGQGTLGTRPHPGLRCRILANNLTRGLIPGPFMHDVPLKGGGKWREQVSRAYFSFCRPYAHFPEYLMLGRTRRPLRIECDQVESWFWRRDARKGKPLKKGGPPVVKIPVSLAAVTTGSFEAADGSVAALVVNTTPEPREAVAILPRRMPVAIYRADRALEKRVTPEEQENRIRLSLEPFGVRVLLMKENGT